MNKAIACSTLIEAHIDLLSSTLALAAAAEFSIPGAIEGVVELERGHIHQSYVITARHPSGEPERFVLQRLNSQVFREPAVLMNTVERVAAELQANAAPGELCLRLIRSDCGEYSIVDVYGYWWRLFEFIENTLSFESVVDAQQAHELGAAFGAFQRRLLGLDFTAIDDSIPNFHDLPARYGQLVRALESDPQGRAGHAHSEIQFAKTHQSLLGELSALCSGDGLPLRAVHNDAKLENVLFDVTTSKPVCVIDLDTVMPGFVMHDFGDLVRTASGRFREDDTDLDGVRVDLNLFGALVAGYLREAKTFVTDVERNSLVSGAKLITYETGLRFLTDYLLGDEYFRAAHANHNLERCRVQFALLGSIESEEALLCEIVQTGGAGDG